MKTKEDIKKEIFEKVKEYYLLAHKKEEFIPGKSKINYAGRVFDEKELISLVDSSLEFWLTAGRFASQFEKEFAEFLGVKYCLLTNSGSSANLLAISALTSPTLGERQMKPGDEVITTAAGFPTTVNPIVQNGLVPVFVDVALGTYNIEHSKIEEAITEKTKAIIVAHTMGNPFNLTEVTRIAKKHNLWLIEDSCDALGSKYDGKYTGTFGDIATFSFYPAHHMSCSKNTPILYVDEKGRVNVDEIEKIYKKYVDNVMSIKVLSFNKANKLEWSIPSAILRHKLGEKKLIKLTTQHGRTVEITEDHSVFVLDKATAHIVPKCGKDIRKDDYVVAANNIPFPSRLKHIDIIDYFKDKDAYVSNYPHSNLKYVKNPDYRWQFKSRDTLPIQYLKEYSLDNENIKVGLSQSTHKIPARLPITEELCRLVGYFIAEGSYSNGLIFSFNSNEIELIQDVCEISKSIFGITPSIYIKGNSANVKLDSKNVEIIFKKVFEIVGHSHCKRIPWFMYCSNEKCINSFVYGFTKGDGSIRILKDNTNRIDVTSVSKELLNDFQYLLSIIGISASFYRRNKNTKKIICGKETRGKENYTLCFSGYVYGNKTIIKSNLTDKNNHSLQIPLNSIFRKYLSVDKNQKIISRNRLKLHIPRNSELYSSIENDLCFLKVRNIETISHNSEDYVYDFSVPEKENFYGGFLGIFLHNTMGEGGALVTNNPKLKRLIESFRDWGRDCWCGPGCDNSCGKRFSQQLGTLPFGYDHKYTYSHIGYNLKVTDMQAAVGVEQLKKLPGFIEARKRNFKSLYDGLKKYEKYFIMPETEKEADPSWFGFLLTVREGIGFTKNDIVKYLEDNKIATRMLFAGNLARQPSFKNVKYRISGGLENTDKIMNNTFWIGVYPGLTGTMITQIFKVFEEFIAMKESE